MMDTEALVKQLIATVKTRVSFSELRTAQGSERYLEGVVLRPQLDICCGVLREALGPPLKDFGKPPQFAPEIEWAIDRLGGVRIGQCLFFANGGERQVAYAALWPWESDPTRVTLKMGLISL